MKKTGEIGKVQWDGEVTILCYHDKCSEKCAVTKGIRWLQAVIHFISPGNNGWNRRSSIVDDKTSNFYTLTLKPATNFYNVEYVTVVENLQKDEQKETGGSNAENQ